MYIYIYIYIYKHRFGSVDEKLVTTYSSLRSVAMTSDMYTYMCMCIYICIFEYIYIYLNIYIYIHRFWSVDDEQFRLAHQN